MIRPSVFLGAQTQHISRTDLGTQKQRNWFTNGIFLGPFFVPDIETSVRRSGRADEYQIQWRVGRVCEYR